MGGRLEAGRIASSPTTAAGSSDRVVGAILAAIVVLAPPIGLAGRVVGFFEDKGKPVPVASLTELDREMLVESFCRRPDLVTPRGGRPQTRCVDGEPSIEEIARAKGRLYWKLSFPGGPTCLASGSSRGRKDTFGRGRSHVGMIGCGQGIVPSPKRPITVDAAMRLEFGTPRATLTRASGLAGAGVEQVGLIEQDGDVHKVPVEDRTYDFGRPPDRPWVAIAAFDDSDDEVYREPLHLQVPRNFPPQRAQPSRPEPLPALPRSAPIQHGETADATIDVYRSGFVAVRFKSTSSRAYRVLRPRADYPRLPITCLDVAYGAGSWEALGLGVTTSFRREMRALLTSPGGGPRPPFDLCMLRGTYGRRWNDSRGVHEAVEVAFTPHGRRFFAEQAAARDLALFVRSPAMRRIRGAIRTNGVNPSAAAVARTFPARVVALNGRVKSFPWGRSGSGAKGLGSSPRLEPRTAGGCTSSCVPDESARTTSVRLRSPSSTSSGPYTQAMTPILASAR